MNDYVIIIGIIFADNRVHGNRFLTNLPIRLLLGSALSENVLEHLTIVVRNPFLAYSEYISLIKINKKKSIRNHAISKW